MIASHDGRSPADVIRCLRALASFPITHLPAYASPLSEADDPVISRCHTMPKSADSVPSKTFPVCALLQIDLLRNMHGRNRGPIGTDAHPVGNTANHIEGKIAGSGITCVDHGPGWLSFALPADGELRRIQSDRLGCCGMHWARDFRSWEHK